MPNSSSIYLHIPFCKRLCGYCDFPKTMALGRKGEVLAAMGEEVVRRSAELEGTVLKTIYFGGGTPSVCEPEELGALLEKIATAVDCTAVEEITVEANPDDLTEEYLRGLRRVGVSRLSIGIQSFRNEDLRMMNRRHDAAGAVRSVESARRAGFDNISIDLIYGLPTLTLEQWEENVQKAIELNVEHISAYCLTIEENTLFGKRGVQVAAEEVVEQEYAAMCRLLHEASYEHYEISNFARPGRRSRHNGAYWRGTPYLGIGPGAHSYDGGHLRSWNSPTIGAYLAGTAAESEVLSEEELYEEYVMVRLRTCEGVSLNEIATKFGTAKAEEFAHRAQRFIHDGVLLQRGTNIAFAEGAWLVSDGVTAEFFD
ncbi:MAG: radical SAM family heme chaperone HemW [Tidjanibacter sp.]|nr:radical SAM family heme chaperone HemW [Tidjanibacter sp.]